MMVALTQCSLFRCEQQLNEREKLGEEEKRVYFSITNFISRNQLDQPGYLISEIESSEALMPKRR
ncbi:hypothetical protein LguiB_023404 [Lonicera macranthoides]